MQTYPATVIPDNPEPDAGWDFDAAHELQAQAREPCGGVPQPIDSEPRDHAWWAAESRRLGTDWCGILNLRAEILELQARRLRHAAMSIRAAS